MSVAKAMLSRALVALSFCIACGAQANDMTLTFGSQSPANTVPAATSAIDYSVTIRNVNDGVNPASNVGVGITIQVNGNTVRADSGEFTSQNCRVDPDFPASWACNNLAEGSSQTATFTWNNPTAGQSTVTFNGFCQLLPETNPTTFCPSSPGVGTTTIVEAAPSLLSKVSGDNQQAAPGDTLAPFVVALADANGNPVAGGTVTWSVSPAGAGSLTSTTTSGADGRSSNTMTISPNTTGAVTVTASILRGTVQTSFTVNVQVVPVPSTFTKVSGDNQQGSPGDTLSPFVVELLDQTGQPVDGNSITWSVSPAAAGSLATTTSTGANGRSNNTLTLGANVAAGTVTVTASAGGGLQQSFSVSVQVVPVPSTFTKVSGDNQQGSPGDTLSPFVVELLDQTGQPVAGNSITWSVSPAAAGSLSSTTTTGTNGRSSNALTLGTNPSGTVTVTASAGSGLQQTFTVNVSAVPSTFTKVSGDNQQASPGDTLSPFVVALVDQGGQAVAGSTITWSVAPAAAGSLADTATGSNGQSSNTLTLAAAATGTVTVTASAGSGLQQTFTVSVQAVPSTFTKVSGDNQQAAPGDTLSPFVVALLDQGGQAVAGNTITWSVAPAVAGSLSSSTATGSDGRSSNTLTLATSAAGTVTVTASAGSGLQQTFTVTVSAVPSTFTRVSGDNQQAAPGDTLTPFVVELVDQGAQAVAGATVTWSVAPAAAGSLADTTTGSNGQSSNALTLAAGAAGTITVTASAGSGLQTTFTVSVAAVPSTSTKVSGDNQQAAPGDTLDPFVVAVVDQGGRAVAGATVTWSVAPAAAGSLADTTTGSNGQSSNTLTLTANAAGTVTVTASAGGGAQATFTVTVQAAPLSVGKVSGDVQQAAPGDTLNPFVVTLADQSGQPVAGSTITWSVEPATAGSLATSTTTGTDGTARNALTIDTNATGTITVTASAGVGAEATFTVNVAAVQVSVDKVSGDAQLAAPGDTLDPFVVAVLGPTGQPLVGSVVNWSVDPQNAGTLVSATTTTGTDGRTSNTLTLGPDADGAITVTAAAVGGSLVTFTVSTNFASIAGLTPNEQSTAAALENTCEALQGGTAGLEALAAACTAEGTELVTAIEQITPEQLASQGNNSVEIQHTQFINITSRMVQLRAGAMGADFNGLSVDFEGQPLLSRGFRYLMSNASGGGASADEPNPMGRLGVFVNGSGSFGDRDSTTDELGFDFDTKGITGGADYRITDKLILGGALGYVSSSMDFDSSRGDQDITGYTVSAYGTWYQSEKAYVDGVVSYGWNAFDIGRRIRFGTTDVTAKGSTDGTELAASIGAGYDFNRDAFTFGPFARVNYIQAEIDAYQEDPAGGLEQGYDDQDVKSLTTYLGGQMSYAISTRRGVFSPQIRMEWAHEFEDDSQSITARFLNDPTSGRFEVSTDNPDRDYLNLGAGLSAVFAEGRSAFIYYETVLGRDELTEHSIAAGLRLEF